MSFTELALAKSSEKITLALIRAKSFLTSFTVYSGDIYSATVPFIVVDAYLDKALLTLATDANSVTSGKYFYDISEQTFYIYSSDITEAEVIVTYQLNFASAPIELSYDLTDDGTFVEYDCRITVASGFNIKLDGSAVGIALVGSGSVTLNNNDGYFNSFLSDLIFEKQSCKIYSTFRELSESQAKLIYDGIITAVENTGSIIKITISNNIQLLSANIISNTVTEDGYKVSGITTQVVGTYRPRIWGRVNGLRLANISAITDSRYSLTGEVSTTLSSATVTGTGTAFLDEVSSGDTIIVNGTEHLVTEVISNTELSIEEAAASSETGPGENEYKSISPIFNRTWLVSARPLREVAANILLQPANIIYEVDAVQDLEIGDVVLVRVDSNYYTRTITSIYANNVVINQSIPDSLGTTNQILRRPVYNLYYNTNQIPLSSDNFVIDNDDTEGCFVDIARDFEIISQSPRTLDLGGLWTGSSGTKLISRSTANEGIPELIRPRDWLLISGVKYEITTVYSTDTVTRIRLVENLHTAVNQQGLSVYSVDPITNSAIVSADVFGETEDGTKSGIWIKNGVQFIKGQLIEQGLGSSLDSSFDDFDNDQPIALVAPRSPFQKNMPKLNTYIKQVNESISGALFIKSDFKFSYKTLDLALDFSTTLPLIDDFDVISWTAKSERNDLYREVNYSYNYQQVDSFTGEPSLLNYVKENDLSILLGNIDTYELDTCFYFLQDVRPSAHRKLILGQMLNTILQIKTNLKYIDLNILDAVLVDFRHLPVNFDTGATMRIMAVLEKKVDGESVSLVVGDLAGIYARRALIVPDSTPDYSAASGFEKMERSWITEENGTIDNSTKSKMRNVII